MTVEQAAPGAGPHEQPGARRLLGTVISTATSPSFFALEFRLEPDRVTTPGRFVAVEATAADGDEILVIARVEDVHEVNPHEDALSSTLHGVLEFDTTYAHEGASTVIYRVASAEPLEEAVLGGDGAVAEIRSVTA